MIIEINGRKYAKTQEEFEKESCFGFYKAYKTRFDFSNSKGRQFASLICNKNFIGFVNSGKNEDGRIFFQYGLCELFEPVFGIPERHLEQESHAKGVFERLKEQLKGGMEEEPLAARIFDLETRSFRNAPAGASKFETLSLHEKVCVQRAIRAADDEVRSIRQNYYNLQDEGKNPETALDAAFSKNWKKEVRKGYEIHKFIGKVDFNQSTAPKINAKPFAPKI